MQIFVHSTQVHNLDVEESDSVRDVKKRIQELEGLPVEKQVFFYQVREEEREGRKRVTNQVHRVEEGKEKDSGWRQGAYRGKRMQCGVRKGK